MAEEVVHRDFHLLGLQHHILQDWISEDGSINAWLPKHEIAERQEYAKRAILEKTRPGDLISFESPEESDYRRFSQIRSGAYKEKYGSQARRLMWAHWRELAKRTYNFYSDLAKFAVENGRKVASLEPSFRKGTIVAQAAHNAPYKSETARRIEFLIGPLTTDFFLARIQQQKPKMVITSQAHAIEIEDRINPISAEYYPDIYYGRYDPVKRRALQRMGRLREVEEVEKRLRREEAKTRKPP